MTSAEVGLADAESPASPGRSVGAPVRASGVRRRAPLAPAVLPEGAHLTRPERIAIGRQARVHTPRSSHAELDFGATRADPLALLEQQAATRVPELVAIRYGRMVVSEFAFFRGAALVMASDLSRTPSSGITAQLCGDAHLSNFGVFASAGRRVVFDINDFDETLPGPWEWDLKRLATSFEVVGRETGLPARTRRPIVERAVRAYREAMAQFAAQTNLSVWYQELHVAAYLADARSRVSRRVRTGGVGDPERDLAKARTRDAMPALATLTHIDGGTPRITPDPPWVMPFADLGELEGMAAWADRQLQSYRRSLQPDRRHLLEQYRFVDVARKGVGVASVGTPCYIALMMGVDNNDLLFLQIKEAQRSVLEQFLGPSGFANHGERVIAGQHTMQASSDIFLGWQRAQDEADGRPGDYYWRQLRDWKGSVEIDGMHPAILSAYAGLCGWTLARAHARSGDRIAIAAYIGRGTVLDAAIADFAVAYADLNARDYAALAAAVTDGRIVADDEAV